MVYLGRTKKIHFVGIGGIGMSGIAEVLLNLGFEVSGSDVYKSDITERLEQMGARLAYSHESDNVLGADVVVYSSAITFTNPELVAAGKQGIQIIPRNEMLGELMRMKYAITIGGAHGKTSTTSLVSSVLAHGGLDPTIVVGGKLKALRTSARLGSGNYIVAEADESDGYFVNLPSTIAVITNIDREHLDHYPNLDAIKRSFIQYAEKVPFFGAVVLCVDDENVCAVGNEIKRRKISYSLGGKADVSGRVIDRDHTGCRFAVFHLEEKIGEVQLGIPGDHYVRNALAAIAVGIELDIPFSLIKQGLEQFEGVGRRFEIKDVLSGITVVDDYGHHPTEIAATIRAANSYFGGRVIVLFQPHRYSRTQAMVEEFGTCFDGAHMVLITDIYPAGEKPIPGVTKDLIVDSVKKNGSAPVHYSPGFDEMVEEVMKMAKTGDVVITMGAGNIFKAGEQLLGKIKDQAVRKSEK